MMNWNVLVIVAQFYVIETARVYNLRCLKYKSMGEDADIDHDIVTLCLHRNIIVSSIIYRISRNKIYISFDVQVLQT